LRSTYPFNGCSPVFLDKLNTGGLLMPLLSQLSMAWTPHLSNGRNPIDVCAMRASLRHQSSLAGRMRWRGGPGSHPGGALLDRTVWRKKHSSRGVSPGGKRDWYKRAMRDKFIDSRS
jgi:hypothetical protein